MNFKTFYCVYESPNAPRDLEYHVNIGEIAYISVNTAGDDTENKGDYFLWLHMRNGDYLAVYRGTKDACKTHFCSVKAVLK